ncbi:hypothetical protein [uncultured Ruminococcus sp.]|uniref:hypothetical protein n=1 Tax=uncultured Ruminococcus sp. TaxID=165186 RepID=UPI0025F9E587|nr:hypothetical protein [uncultured Ruminococcus sp.]
MKTRKLLASILALTMVLAMTACGESGTGGSSSAAESSAAETKTEGSQAEDSQAEDDQAEVSQAEESQADESSEPETPAIETETYTVKKSDGTAASFEWVKSDLYTVKEDDTGSGTTIIYGESDATIKIMLKYDFPKQSAITMQETDFYGDHHDYAKITVADRDGWEVYNGTNEYECEFIISDPDEEGKVYALWVNVNRSSLCSEDMMFEMTDFANSEEFDVFKNSPVVTKTAAEAAAEAEAGDASEAESAETEDSGAATAEGADTEETAE